MKAILKYPLYRRQSPTNEVEAVGYLEVNSVIEVKQIVAGKPLDGISIWFYADDGFYYWGGGVNFNEAEEFINWDELNEEIKLSILISITNDTAYWIEKNVIGALGFAVGYKNDSNSSGLALSIFVDMKIITENVPKTIVYIGVGGIPTDIKEAGEIKHNLANEILTPDEDLPMRMGGSISVKNPKEFGTRGLLLTKDKKQFLLTCFHVLLSEFPKNTLYEGVPVRLAEYPSPLKNSSVEIKTGLITYGCYDSNNDFALVKLENVNDFINGFGRSRFKGFHDANTISSLLDKQVTTAGAVSNFQQGKVLDTNATVTITQTGMRFENVVITKKLSVPGDSGAPVIDENNKIVGIVIASDDSLRSYILPIHNLIILNGYRLS